MQKSLADHAALPVPRISGRLDDTVDVLGSFSSGPGIE
jgi:hypothetical protein